MTDENEKLNLMMRAIGRLDEIDEQDKIALQQKLNEDVEAQKEAQFLESLKEGLKGLNESDDDSDGKNSPGELGLARLKRDILNENTSASKEATSARASTNPGFWRPMAIAASVLFAAQLFFILPDKESGSDIETLSGSALAAGPRLQVAFSNKTTMEQLQSALAAIDARIVDGPGALGLYTLELRQDANMQKVLNALNAFDFVEELNVVKGSDQ